VRTPMSLGNKRNRRGGNGRSTFSSDMDMEAWGLWLLQVCGSGSKIKE